MYMYYLFGDTLRYMQKLFILGHANRKDECMQNICRYVKKQNKKNSLLQQEFPPSSGNIFLLIEDIIYMFF